MCTMHLLYDETLLAMIAKYGVLISELGGLYYALLELSINKKALWKIVLVDDWTAELVIIASNAMRFLYIAPHMWWASLLFFKNNLLRTNQWDCLGSSLPFTYAPILMLVLNVILLKHYRYLTDKYVSLIIPYSWSARDLHRWIWK